jgi:hypothetical protein
VEKQFFEYKSFVYLTHIIGNFTGSSVWRQAAPQLPLYEFSVNLGTHILFCYVAVGIKFLLTVFKEGTINGFFWPTDPCHT